MRYAEDIQPIERYLLMLLLAPDSSGKFSQPIRGNTWCQKEMFVLSKLVEGLEEDTQFDAYAMGSYSETVAEIQDQFYISGFAEKSGDGMKLSLDGRRLAEEVWTHATEDERRVVGEVKSWLNDLSFHELLALLYTEYPESTTKSQVKDEIDIRRPELAVSLVRKRKVTPELGARIARMKQADFSTYLEKRGISPEGIETSDILVDKALLEEIEKSRDDSAKRRLIPWEKTKENA